MASRDSSGAFRLRPPWGERGLPLLPGGGRSACVGCGHAVFSGRCSRCGTTREAGRYLAVKVIGQRTFSRTYLAVDPKYDQHVVLKELWFNQVPGRAELEAFERE